MKTPRKNHHVPPIQYRENSVAFSDQDYRQPSASKADQTISIDTAGPPVSSSSNPIAKLEATDRFTGFRLQKDTTPEKLDQIVEEVQSVFFKLLFLQESLKGPANPANMPKVLPVSDVQQLDSTRDNTKFNPITFVTGLEFMSDLVSGRLDPAYDPLEDNEAIEKRAENLETQLEIIGLVDDLMNGR